MQTTLRLDPIRLAQRRQLAGLSQEEFARRIKSTQPHLSRLERGAVSASPKFIKRCADGLDCDVLDIAEFDTTLEEAS